MFAKLSVLAAVIPFVLGLSLDTPTNVTSGLRSDVTWTATDDDPTFSLELNHPSFRNSFALANNVNAQSGSPLSIEWPIVPADSQYTLSAVNVSNINQVFASSGQFAIAQAPTSASATFSTTFTPGVSASGSSASSTAPGSSSTGSSAGSATGGTSGASSTSSAASSTGSTGSFNGNGAASFQTGNTAVIAAVLAAVAGATLFL
ncbi:hypothetical protein GYMLUDRAFT_78257 [Collybiopsis luxurians FD-317 M1]|uniref:Uncharacterized protein n=1 Tax=Collybiopsis luxurians FD-317 M1 TaxID=944289 RepID=A0A0D0BP41_9AGAR|nr:hypothetical protein GYMLUDRAFT_78257 [Collybiopsis luxurians FD-317 M1]